MDYREFAPPPHLAGLVKLRWTLAAEGGAGAWLPQQATPDGCVEIIRRIRGRSRWGGDQPSCFVVGLVDRPQPFEISGDAAFEALRLWPWAWGLVGAAPLSALSGRWAPFSADFAAIETRLAAARLAPPHPLPECVRDAARRAEPRRSCRRARLRRPSAYGARVPGACGRPRDSRSPPRARSVSGLARQARRIGRRLTFRCGALSSMDSAPPPG